MIHPWLLFVLRTLLWINLLVFILPSAIHRSLAGGFRPREERGCLCLEGEPQCAPKRVETPHLPCSMLIQCGVVPTDFYAFFQHWKGGGGNYSVPIALMFWRGLQLRCWDRNNVETSPSPDCPTFFWPRLYVHATDRQLLQYSLRISPSFFLWMWGDFPFLTSFLTFSSHAQSDARFKRQELLRMTDLWASKSCAQKRNWARVARSHLEDRWKHAQVLTAQTETCTSHVWRLGPSLTTRIVTRTVILLTLSAPRAGSWTRGYEQSQIGSGQNALVSTGSLCGCWNSIRTTAGVSRASPYISL